MRQDIKQVIKCVMKEEKITQEDICKVVGAYNQSDLSRLMRTDIRLSRFLLLLHSINCELIIRHKNVDYRF